MEDEQRIRIIAALTEAYVTLQDKNLLAEYEARIAPLLETVSSAERVTLAAEFREKTAFSDEVHSLTGLAFYIDPTVGGS